MGGELAHRLNALIRDILDKNQGLCTQFYGYRSIL